MISSLHPPIHLQTISETHDELTAYLFFFLNLVISKLMYFPFLRYPAFFFFFFLAFNFGYWATAGHFKKVLPRMTTSSVLQTLIVLLSCI